MSSGTDTQVAPAPKTEAEKPPAAPAAQANARPPQTEELLCTICGMRSCWR